MGNYKDAGDLRFLTSHRVTHILCSAAELTPLFPGRFKYKHVVADDVPYFNLSRYFDGAADFIHDAMRSNGVVLVHCAAGISRSVSLTLAYLMKYERMKLAPALSLIKSRRFIANPNPGFLRQLKEYESRLDDFWARQERNTETRLSRPTSQGAGYDRQGARRTVGPEQEYLTRTNGYTQPTTYGRNPSNRGAVGGLLRTPTESWLIQRQGDDVTIDASGISKTLGGGGQLSKTFGGGFGMTEKNLTRTTSLRPSYGNSMIEARFDTMKTIEAKPEDQIGRNPRDTKSIEKKYVPTVSHVQRSRQGLESKPRFSASTAMPGYAGSPYYPIAKSKDWEGGRVSPRMTASYSKNTQPNQFLRHTVGSAGFGTRAQYPIYSQPTTVLLGPSNTYYIR